MSNKDITGKYSKREERKKRLAFMHNISNLSAVKLTEMGMPTSGSQGFSEITRRIRLIAPQIGGNVRDTMAAFVGQGDEAKRLSLLWASKKAQRKLRKHEFHSRQSFYKTPEWRQLRYFVLRRDGGRCACCGSTAKDGSQLHVDHIKPRSEAPELELVADNLQVLCEDCNLGKSNWDDTDWRSGMAHIREVANG